MPDQEPLPGAPEVTTPIGGNQPVEESVRVPSDVHERPEDLVPEPTNPRDGRDPQPIS